MFEAIGHKLAQACASAVVVSAIMSAAIAPAAFAQEKPMQRSITVSASGSVSAPPDRARINAGVLTQAATAREAMSANSAAMDKVIATIKAAGVDAKDIQTSDLSVTQATRYDNQTNEPIVLGYRASNQVSILIRDLKRIGEIMDMVITAGAKQINGLSFEVSNADELKDEARTEAMAAAKRRAELLAKAGGATVGRVIEITESVMNEGPILRGRMAKMAAESVPVETGTLDLSAQVTVTWELN